MRSLHEESYRYIYGCTGGFNRIVGHIMNSKINSLFYLTKYRLKDPESLIKKVENKRKDNPDYDIEDVTDLVGLRFLALFSSDLPDLISELCSFLESCGERRGGYIVGDGLDGILTEAVVYIPNRHVDVSYQTAIEELVARGIPLVPFDPLEEECAPPFRIERKDGDYSSIHLLCRVCAQSDEIGSIPTEIQIRTPFEDIWAEIDHRLIYKNPNLSEGDPKKIIGKKMSDTLKRHLDACSDTAVDLRNYLSPQEKSRSTKSLNRSRDYDRILRYKHEDQKVNDAVRKFVDFQEALATEENLPLYNKAISTGEWLLKQYEPGLDDDSEEARNLLRLALGLLYLKRNPLLKLELANGAPLERDPRQDLQRSYDLYQEVLKSRVTKNNPLLFVRLAQVQSALNNNTTAQRMYRRALEAMNSDDAGKWLADTDLFRLIIPRKFATEVYRIANELEEENKYLPREARGAELSEIKEHYRRCIEVVFDTLINKYPKVCNSENNECITEKIYLSNLLVDSVVKFVGIGGEIEELAPFDLSDKVIAGYAGLLIDLDEERQTPGILDTVRAYARRAGNWELEQSAAQKVLALLAKPDFAVRYPAEWVEEMVRDARLSLSRGT